MSKELGPLPKPHMRKSVATLQNTSSVRHGFEQGGYERWPDMYTADQMRAYAAQEVAAERERCARICEGRADRLAKYPSYFETVEYLRECAAEILQP